VIAIFCYLVAQQFPTTPPKIRHDADADTAAIVRAVIPLMPPDREYVVVADRTLTICPEADRGETCIGPIFTRMLDDALELAPEGWKILKTRMFQANVKSTKLPPLHAANARVVPLHTIQDILSHKGSWTEFYRRYPRSNGYFAVTMPVFSDDHQNALLYVSHSCGEACGTGWLMYMTHANGSWQIADKWMLWIS